MPERGPAEHHANSRCRVALFGCSFVPSGCLLEVLRSPDADIVGEPEPVLGLWIAAFGIPPQRVGGVLRVTYGSPNEFVGCLASNTVNQSRIRAAASAAAKADCKAMIIKKCTTGSRLQTISSRSNPAAPRRPLSRG